ncbi:MAG: hypothetical protein Q8J64_07625 [Thermodesulfovibrionales bacterium]|nr:hypothetical protein [Thermodesulfovibrionales bacterium]
MPKQLKTDRPDFYPVFIAAFALLSYGRIFFLADVFWDDNAWFLSLYKSKDLDGFLNTGWLELRRAANGIFTYYFFSLHKNTDYFYIIGHSLNLVTQVLTPCFLYLLVRDLFGKRFPAFLSAAVLLIYPIDYTLPIFSTITYRLGSLLSVISLYLTMRAFSGDKRWPLLAVGLALSGFSEYVLLEAAVALEPARLFIIGYSFYREGADRKHIIKNLVKYGSPFILLLMPLIFYKLIYKPFGIYTDIYKSDPLFFLKWKLHLEFLKHFFFVNWFRFTGIVDWTRYASLWSVMLGILGMLSGLYALRGVFKEEESLKQSPAAQWRTGMLVLAFGLIILIPSVSLYEFTGRVPGFRIESRHGIIVQLGYAMVWGSLLFILPAFFLKNSFKKSAFKLFVSALIGIGIFFSNFNLDLAYNSWQKQAGFWRAFTARFPVIPEKAAFFFDIYLDMPVFDTEFDNEYDYEFVLNALYATSEKPEDFRKHVALCRNDFTAGNVMDREALVLYLTGNTKRTQFRYDSQHWGKSLIDTDDVIFVFYNLDGSLLVNKELLQYFPQLGYDYFFRSLLDKELPELPSSTPPAYPLRHKLKGFY